MILCPRCKSSYVEQNDRYLQQSFKEHVGNKSPMKTYFENCDIAPTDGIISSLGRMDRDDSRLLTLEALFIKDIARLYSIQKMCTGVQPLHQNVKISWLSIFSSLS